METVIGVLILVLEFFLHPGVSVPLPNFWPPVVVEKCQKKIPLGLLEGPTFDLALLIHSKYFICLL
jgi:hypothetical protein